ncbi:zinc finger protein 2-like [Eupeodes corollae]|uniref:zinc finger protein 2-like n=1 Tax=Eupeodes corollae TaxID=290404 RepID=UPI0024934766|nr:zinc finger protein 2-like [Eupeodes corollae]
MDSTIICRACLNEIARQYISLDTPLNDTTVLDVFNYCTNLKANLNDDFPTSICIPCGRALQAAYDFIKTAFETDQILRNSIGTGEQQSVKESASQEENIIQELKEIEYDIDKEYAEEYIENIDDTDIKEENEHYQFLTLSPKEEIDVELIDEGEHCYVESINEAEVPEESIESQKYELTDEADNCCSRSENSYAHEGFLEDAEDIQYQSDNKEGTIEGKKQSKANRLYKCDSCEKQFKNMLSRNKHEFFEHREDDDSQHRKCKLCDFKTSSLSSWQTHRYRHENPTQKKYLCSFCPKKFANPKSLLMHEDYRHGNKERAAKCEKCGKKFMNKQKLDYHILSAHSNGRNYQCPECPKTFKNSFQLRAHKKLHTERTIECPECEKKFLRNVDLKVHMRIHTGELPYQCHLCDKRYRIKVRLTYHMQKHLGTKHVCEICSCEFNSKPRLRLHMFEHIGMPFVCDHCEMGFKTRLGLSRHTKAVHNIIMTDDELLQNRLKNERNIKRGIVSDLALLDHSNAELEV